MPVKKVSRSRNITNGFDIQNFVQNPDSYKSLIYGIVTVAILFVVLFLGLRTISKNKANITDTAVNTVQQSVKTHVVKEGETLWSIAETQYGDGFKWEVIAKANNITNATSLEKGMRLTIPPIDKGEVSSTTVVTQAVSPTVAATKAPTPTISRVASPTLAPRPTVSIPVERKIAGNSYKVVLGDNLWDIATRAYGDGYRWVEIARDNKLANPDLIHPGNVFKLPRP